MRKLLVLLAMILLPMMASAQTVVVDGITYKLITKGKIAEVMESRDSTIMEIEVWDEKGDSIKLDSIVVRKPYSGDVVIPEQFIYDDITYTVISIGGHAFEGTSITSITIPNSLKSIDEYAFYKCAKLSAVKVYDLTAWCNIDFKGFAASPLQYAHRLYVNDEEIVDLVIPSKVTTINRDAFKGCTSITSVTFPNSVTSIGYESFYDCTNLTSATIGDNNNVASTIIGFRAFSRCSVLESVTIGNNVKQIERNAFEYCISLDSITIPNSVESIGTHVFMGCTNLSSVKLPENISSIEWATFAGCTSLESIVIPNNVKTIGEGAFSGCTNLTSIILPNNLSSIGAIAFEECSSLTSITIPDKVTTIEMGTFHYCKKLTDITLGRGIKSLSCGSFAFCPQLSNVYCYAKDAPICNNGCTSYYGKATGPFKDSYIEYATLHVPAQSVDAYKAAEPWKDFKEIVPIEGTESGEPTETDDDKIVVAGFSATKGQQATFSINLENKDTDLTAYQFDLTLPDGISLSVNDKGKYVVTKTNRYEDDNQKLDISKMEGNTYRFVCSSMSSEKITGTSGAILNAALTIGASVNDGNYEAAIANIIVTKVNGTQLKLKDAKFNIVVTNIIKGDANGDGEVNVSDIVEIIDYIMNKPSDKFVYAAADLNEDGEVNVTDIVKVVYIIMSSGSNAPKRASVVEMADNDQLTLVVSDKSLTLCLDNEAQYVASQFEIRLGDGQTLESISLNNKRSGGHLMSYAKTGDNLYKVVVYSTDNCPFNGNSGELLSFKVSGIGNVEVSNILFVTSRETEKLFPALVAGTTGIDVIKTSEAMDIYSVDGRLIQKQATNTNGLKKGAYIISGKKMIVK